MDKKIPVPDQITGQSTGIFCPFIGNGSAPFILQILPMPPHPQQLSHHYVTAE